MPPWIFTWYDEIKNKQVTAQAVKRILGEACWVVFGGHNVTDQKKRRPFQKFTIVINNLPWNKIWAHNVLVWSWIFLIRLRSETSPFQHITLPLYKVQTEIKVNQKMQKRGKVLLCPDNPPQRPTPLSQNISANSRTPDLLIVFLCVLIHWYAE